MSVRLALTVGAIGALLGIAALQACSIQSGGSGAIVPDASADVGEDVVPDVVVAPDVVSDVHDAGPPDVACTGVRCNGQCMPASDCRTCTGAPLLCAATGQCLPSCAGCSGANGAAMPIECFACDQNRANPLGTCEPNDAASYCLNGDYISASVGGAAGYRCVCEGGVSQCPGATQVCATLGTINMVQFCLTCGEVTAATLQGASCKGGGACDTASNACK